MLKANVDLLGPGLAEEGSDPWNEPPGGLEVGPLRAGRGHQGGQGDQDEGLHLGHSCKI